MSAQEYYGGDNKASYSRPDAPPPSHVGQGSQVDYKQERSRGQQQQQYYPPQQQYQQQQYQQPQYQQQPYQQQQQPQYYQQPGGQQPIYVQQQAPSKGNNDCLTACLAALCVCCTLDLLF